MNWRLAESLDQLRDQINAAYPKRSRISDGSIGDTAHATRSSDHNPWVDDAVVTAIDITHDPANSCDCNRIVAALVASRDPRIKYLIWNRRICRSYPSRSGLPAWTWGPYDGINAHAHHFHISVQPQRALYDSRRPWRITQPATPPAPPSPEADKVLKLVQETRDNAYVWITDGVVRRRLPDWTHADTLKRLGLLPTGRTVLPISAAHLEAIVRVDEE